MAYLDALKKIDPGNLELAQYISHTSPEDADYTAMYGEYWDELVAAKRKYDPMNVFRSYVQYDARVIGNKSIEVVIHIFILVVGDLNVKSNP